MITTSLHPDHDTVLYDGDCRFCRGQIGILRRLDLLGSLAFTSFHDPRVAVDFPELPPEELERLPESAFLKVKSEWFFNRIDTLEQRICLISSLLVSALVMQ
jgi:predicted DCC family thiol-disulfide oxidoreductase YuxK